MRELRPLQLPGLVEARRKRESETAPSLMSSDGASIGYSLGHSRSSTSSEVPSPITPTFSARSHSRLSSSSSSLASSPTMRESLDGFNATKRPLTDVKEEPPEKDEDIETIDRLQADRNHNHNIEIEKVISQSYCFPLEYDLANDFPRDFSSEQSHGTKRRCAEETPFSGLTSRFGSHFPSFSRRWNNRRLGNSNSVVESLQDNSAPRSRANSTRAPSLVDTVGDSGDRGDHQFPPTPARSVHDDYRDDAPVSPIDIQKANAPLDGEEDDIEDLATTPLLPPLMVQFLSKALEEPAQSPLQSPTIAESPSVVHSPIDGSRFNGLPSPPLSTKPSISSFHHRQLPPSSENPSIDLADPHDEWSKKLGHANFTIHPEPYLPTSFDLPSCKQLRVDWDAARLNFMRHLARTGEYYSTKSRIHQLTEEKWAEIDAQWKRNTELIRANLPDHPSEALALSKQTTSVETVPLIKIPSLNGPRSAGKFPKLCDEGIVGPMIREEKSQLPRRSSRKRGFWKFLQGVLPSSVAFGRGQA